jgi:hemolysin III
MAQLAAPRVATPLVAAPKLRGWFHLGTLPFAIAGGFALVGMATEHRARISALIFAVTACLLFAVSSIYHRGTWGPKTKALLQRLDHATIFLVIAGSYTPFALVLLPPDQARRLLLIVWSGAVAGAALRLLWVGAPRWFQLPIYFALGFASIFYLPGFRGSGSSLVFTLILLGGIFYSIGGLIFALQRPNLIPNWFGFHELFHALTVLAFGLHYAAAAITVASVIT